MQYRLAAFAVMTGLPLSSPAVAPGLIQVAAQPGPAPSVLVQAVRVQKGALPHWVAGYGVAVAEAGADRTVSAPLEGHVARVEAVPGQAVKAGQTLLVITPSPAVRTAYWQAQAAVQAARRVREHTRAMLQQRLATRDQLAQADKALVDAVSSLAALREAGASNNGVAMHALFAGVVETVAVSPGAWVAPGAAMLTLGRAGGLTVRARIEPAERGIVQPGQAVRLEGLMDYAALTGRVRQIGRRIDPVAHGILVTVGPESGALLDGAAYRARIHAGDYQGWIIPDAALQRAGQGYAVFQLHDGRTHRVPVTLVGRTGDRDAVAGSLDPAQPVVTEGGYQLQDGMPVRLAQPAP